MPIPQIHEQLQWMCMPLLSGNKTRFPQNVQCKRTQYSLETLGARKINFLFVVQVNSAAVARYEKMLNLTDDQSKSLLLFQLSPLFFSAKFGLRQTSSFARIPYYKDPSPLGGTQRWSRRWRLHTKSARFCDWLQHLSSFTIMGGLHITWRGLQLLCPLWPFNLKYQKEIFRSSKMESTLTTST